MYHSFLCKTTIHSPLNFHDRTKSFQKKLNLKHAKMFNGKTCYVLRATWAKLSLNVGSVKFNTRDEECMSLRFK
jgi:hypothetical protein